MIRYGTYRKNWAQKYFVSFSSSMTKKKEPNMLGGFQGDFTMPGEEKHKEQVWQDCERGDWVCESKKHQ